MIARDPGLICVLDTDGRTVIPLYTETDYDRWFVWMQTHRDERIVAQTAVGVYFVSTVFLGCYIGRNNECFETMIEPCGKRDRPGYVRTDTWAKAEEIHRCAVAAVADDQGIKNPLTVGGTVREEEGEGA